ncbi:MAG: UDP-N-acetylmuramoyl-tripeptide--D-alanyl-D-alanine ligase [Candidatus Omnitrophota bacterium]
MVKLTGPIVMFDVKDILEATGGALLTAGSQGARFSGVSTDTRTLKTEALFIAIKGLNFDGHNFINEAKLKGAIGAVVSRDFSCRYFPAADKEMAGFVLIKVSDTIKALGDIAKFHRKRFNIPIVAVTGSNGKTTTKEMLAVLLAGRYNALKNEGTENNLIGASQTLLRLNNNFDIAILEFGTNHFGEIARLSEIASPSCAVILNAGYSHLEYFGSVDNVRLEKLSILKQMEGDYFCAVNGDDPALLKGAESVCAGAVSFGLGPRCKFRATSITEDEGRVKFILNEKQKFSLKIPGRHNVHNALAAIAVGSLLGLEFEDMARALERFALPKMRMEFVTLSGIRFIFDCHNSNPSSMACAIETLSGMGSPGRKILVAGDMLELGVKGPDFHKEIGRLAARSKVDMLVGVGPLSRFILDEARNEGVDDESLLHFDNSKEAGKGLKDMFREGDLVLVKGSRGLKMEEIRRCFTTCCIR